MTSLSEVSDYLDKILLRMKGGIEGTIVKQVVTTSFERSSMYEGNLYASGFLFDDVRDGESAFFFIDNTDGETLLDIESLIIRSAGKSIITITQDPNVDSAGSPAQIRNKRTGEPDEISGSITRDGTYSGGDEEEDVLLPGGTGQDFIGGETTDRFALIDIGDSMLIEMFNDAGRTVDQEIKIRFSEVDPN